MILDNIKNAGLYYSSDTKIGKALEYLKNKDFSKDEKGVHQVDGDDLYYVVVEYNTKEKENGFWESHKKYIDIHYMISGQEKLLYSNFNHVEIEKDYDEKVDAYILKGKSEGESILKEGFFMLYFPEDVHMTGIRVNSSEPIRKIIFKVAID
ncbi:DUF386 domain-containing protein [Clostridium niameyense]|uniref:DUF386 domain-containing protein n=1 Tax=Clostridium niameyense TaxID=1622073 RepID=A0A6M0RCM6_9CLOT|nr:YhcH/YjgK/YiaL family protein [Clostridium niameyense]NEZ47460.1 DUF386 domain-containing protein [Clostridium niameyense]